LTSLVKYCIIIAVAIIRLFVTNLSYEATESDLRELFSSVGKPTVINIMKDHETNAPRGFGFVTLDTMGASPDCWREELQGHILKGRPLHIDIAIPKEKMKKEKN